jgi:hypothetical protein
MQTLRLRAALGYDESDVVVLAKLLSSKPD